MSDSRSGGEAPSSIAALAVQVDTLRREVESLAAKTDMLAGTQQEQTAALDDVSKLRRQIKQILDHLDDEGDASASGWFWLRMGDQEREEKLSELSDWVEMVLRVQYPDYLSEQIRPCWPNHPEARWELAWLYQLWCAAYLAKRPTARDAADWHDRWLPGVASRLSHLMLRCQETCQRESRPEELLRVGKLIP